jgi:hypothetical protein
MSTMLLTQPATPHTNELQVQQRQESNWATVALCALVIAYADGFWVTSLQGTIGAIERNRPPFTRWLADSTLMLPLVGVAVVAALALTRRWFGQRRELVTVAAAAVLVTVTTTLLGIAELAASAAVDYHLQARDLAVKYASHLHHLPATGSANATVCDGLCAAQRATLLVHVHAVGYAAIVLLLTNLVLVTWALALRGGRLWKRRATPIATTA